MQTFVLIAAISVCISTAVVQAALDIANFRQCAKIWMEAYCSDYVALARSHLDASLNCDNIHWRNQLSNTCTRNRENEVYCGAVFGYSTAIGAIPIECASTIAGDNCTSRCRNSLVSIRNDLGCCINTIVNKTWSAFTFALSGFAFDLWSRCDVDLPDSNCTNPLPFTLPSVQQQSNCRPEEFLGCMPSTQAAIQDTFLMTREPGCESVVHYYEDLCSRDEASGTLCIDTILTTDITTAINQIQTSCATVRAEACTSDCKVHLEQFTGTHPGCCVNSLFNSTYASVIGVNRLTPFLEDDTLFRACGVETPPLSCADTSTSLGPPLKGCINTLLLSLTLALFVSRMASSS